MDVDFPLILSWAVLISGAIWLVDVLWLRRRRLTTTAAATHTHPSKSSSEFAQEPLVVEYARSFFPVLLLVLILRSFLVEPYQIPTPSMVPTLEIGDFILVNKYAYGIRLPVLGTKIFDVGDPQRGDVMVFVPKHEPKYFIKRVVGLPGDKIRYHNKTLYINGERLDYRLVREFSGQGRAGETVAIREYSEQLGDAKHPVYRYPYAERGQQWQVPAGHYFMMGDNRGRSFDSRGWGARDPELTFVPNENIVGRAFAIWMHMPGWRWPSFSRNQVIQ